MLNSAWKGHTGSEIVGAPMCAYILLRGEPWTRSHKSVPIIPAIGLSVLLLEGVRTTAKVLTILDYMHRPDGDEYNIDWCEWEELYEGCKQIGHSMLDFKPVIPMWL